MNIREAILKAADYIEKHPGDYSFWHTGIPECGTRGCMLGWIGCFAGLKGSVSDTEMLLGTLTPANEESGFYLRIRALGNVGAACELTAETAPNILRLYADKYHPAPKEKPLGADICRAIMAKEFKETAHAN